jgi:hypothetical protein
VQSQPCFVGLIALVKVYVDAVDSVDHEGAQLCTAWVLHPADLLAVEDEPAHLQQPAAYSGCVLLGYWSRAGLRASLNVLTVGRFLAQLHGWQGGRQTFQLRRPPFNLFRSPSCGMAVHQRRPHDTINLHDGVVDQALHAPSSWNSELYSRLDTHFRSASPILKDRYIWPARPFRP